MPQNLKPLTAMRFFAAMWVVAYDYWPNLGVETPRFIAKGYLGVELFFVLSGFILSHVYLPAFGEGRFRYPDFLWTRLARIYPVHVFTLAGMGLLAALAALLGLPVGDKALIWSSLPAQMTLTQAWGLGLHGGWNHPSWSISAEWFAYLAFPAFAWAAWHLRHRPALAVLLGLALMVVLETGFSSLAGFPLTKATIAWGALRIVPCFALGCAVYLAWSRHRIGSPSLALGATAVAVVALVVAAHAGAPDAAFIGLFGALIFGLASLASAGSKVLTAPLWVYLGEVSFPIYMVCIPWQLAFDKGAHRLFGVAETALPLPIWSIKALGVIPAAMVIHHLVERPTREAMRRHGVPFTAPSSFAKQAAQPSPVG